MNWIKINNEVFETKSGCVQFSMGSHATINTSFDINKHPEYLKHFIKLYEGGTKFNVEHVNYIGKGTFIKSMDTDFDKIMNIDFRCDVLETTDKEERRNEMIQTVLDETLSNNKDINLKS